MHLLKPDIMTELSFGMHGCKFVLIQLKSQMLRLQGAPKMR